MSVNVLYISKQKCLIIWHLALMLVKTLIGNIIPPLNRTIFSYNIDINWLVSVNGLQFWLPEASVTCLCIKTCVMKHTLCCEMYLHLLCKWKQIELRVKANTPLLHCRPGALVFLRATAIWTSPLTFWKWLSVPNHVGHDNVGHFHRGEVRGTWLFQ